MTAGGSNYAFPPAVILGGGPPLGGVATPQSSTIIGGSPFSPLVATGAGNVAGTFVGLDTPAATGQYPYGSGATGVAIVSNGAVVGVVMTGFGSGYKIAPTVTFVGGNTFSPGMIAHVNKPSATTGLGIGNVRVVGPYQIGITFINDSTAGITPTGEAYRFLVMNELPAVSNVLQYVWQSYTPIMGLLGTTGSSLELPVTIASILANDFAMGVSKPSAQTGSAISNVRVAAASLLSIGFMVPGVAVTITGGEFWNAAIWRQQPAAPSQQYSPYLAFTTAITALSTSEIAVTVPGLPVNTVVQVNKPTLTGGVALTGARVSAASIVQLTFHNNTATAVTLPTEFYGIECFSTPIPSAGVNALSYHIQQVNPSYNALLDLGNEVRDAKVAFGVIKGS